MMSDETQELDVDSLIHKAFEYFERYVERDNQLASVLLEALEPQDDGWIISIGFNGERQEFSEPAGGFSAIAGLGSKTTKTVREVRHIQLDRFGNLKKID